MEETLLDMRCKLLITLSIFCLFFLPQCADLDKAVSRELVNDGKNLIPFVQFDLDDEQKWGYLDEDTGEIAIEAKYVWVSPFSGNYAAVLRGWREKQLIIDKNEKVILSFSPFQKVSFIVSESGKNTLAILQTTHNEEKFRVGWFKGGKTGFYTAEIHDYQFINLANRKTIIPQKGKYSIQNIEAVGDYFIADEDLYQFLDNGNLKVVVKNNNERAAGILRDYLKERGINASIVTHRSGVNIDYSPYIRAQYADPDFSGAVRNLPAEFSIPFEKAQPFYRDTRELLNASLEINERKYLMQYLNKETGEYAKGIYNESKTEWELLPFLTYNNKRYNVAEILQTNNPSLYRLSLKNNDIGWNNKKYLLVGGGVFNVVEKKFLNNLKALDTSPSLILSKEGKRSIRFPNGGVYFEDHERIRNIPVSHSEYVKYVAFSPDGKSVISCSDDNKAKLWDTASGDLIRTFVPQEGGINRAAFSPDGGIIAAGLTDGKIIIFDVTTGDITRIIDGHEDSVCTISFSPDGNTFVTGSEDNTIKIWDTASGNLVKTINARSGGVNSGTYRPLVNSVAYSPDGTTIISGSGDKTIKLWDIASGNLLGTFKGHSHSVESVAFSSDGKTFVSGSLDLTVGLWDISKNRRIRTFKHSDIVLSVMFSPDGDTIVSAGYDKVIQLWDAKKGRLSRTISGGLRYSRSVAYSPDTQTIVSGGENKKVKLWDAKSGELIRTFVDRDL
jgi:WD40 repeat protein